LLETYTTIFIIGPTQTSTIVNVDTSVTISTVVSA
jgi:hypothetical protein